MGGEHVRFLLTRANLGHRMNYVGDKLAVEIILRDFIIYIYISIPYSKRWFSIFKFFLVRQCESFENCKKAK